MTVVIAVTPELWEALLNGLRFEKKDYASIILGPVAFFGVYAMFYFLLRQTQLSIKNKRVECGSYVEIKKGTQDPRMPEGRRDGLVVKVSGKKKDND